MKKLLCNKSPSNGLVQITQKCEHCVANGSGNCGPINRDGWTWMDVDNWGLAGSSRSQDRGRKGFAGFSGILQ